MAKGNGRRFINTLILFWIETFLLYQLRETNFFHQMPASEELVVLYNAEKRCNVLLPQDFISSHLDCKQSLAILKLKWRAENNIDMKLAYVAWSWGNSRVKYNCSLT